jgi:anti-anti-sigma factor
MDRWVGPGSTVVLPHVLDGPVLDVVRDRLFAEVRRSDRVRVDAQAVEQISGAGLGVLVAATLEARERGTRIELVAASELFRRSIELTGLSRHVDPMVVS